MSTTWYCIKHYLVRNNSSALAIIGKIITTPFMKLVDSKTFATHILDLNKHFHHLQIDLKHWSSTPDDLLTGISVIWVMSPPNIDHKLFFFSKERKKLSCDTLIQKLLKIVNHTNSVLAGIDATLNIPKEQRKQLVLHKQDEHISAFQRSACNQNPTEE